MSDTSTVEKVLKQDGGGTRVTFPRLSLVLAFFRGAWFFLRAQAVGRLAGETFVDEFDGKVEALSQFEGEGVDFEAALGFFTFEGEGVAEDEVCDVQSGDFTGDLGKALGGVVGGRGGEGEGKTEFIAMA